MDFIVRKNKWIRGGIMKSTLRNDQGYMCCLGFVCRQLNVSVNDILNEPFPVDVIENVDDFEKRQILFKKLGILVNKKKDNYIDKAWVSKAADVNDDPDITDEQRIKEITSIFKRAGHTITFV